MVNMESPIVVAGMLRSGTTMLASILEKMGVLMGRCKSSKESELFKSVNKWILGQLMSNWANPEDIGLLLEDEERLSFLSDQSRFIVDQKGLSGYLGVKNMIYERLSSGRIKKWGWKDPRNCLTLDVWKRVFGDMNLVYIERNGVDVASSLSKLQSKKETSKMDMYVKERNKINRYGLIYKIWKILRWGQMSSFFTSGRTAVNCTSINKSFDLWKKYVTRARSQVKKMGDSALHVSYEKVLRDTESELRRISNFCKIDISDGEIDTISEYIDPSSANRFKGEKELMSFARRKKNDLKEFGYSV